MSAAATYRVDAPGLALLLARELDAGARVIGPVARPAVAGGGGGDDGESTDYAEVRDPARLVLDGPLPRTPLKAFFLPKTEPLLRWERRAEGLAVTPAAPDRRRTIVAGARACDAAALAILDAVMGWDTRDELWFARREAATILVAACAVEDEACFCGAVGLGPGGTRGADVLLVPDAGGWLLQAVTPKGEAFVDAHAGAAAVDAAGAGEPPLLRRAEDDAIERSGWSGEELRRRSMDGMSADLPALRARLLRSYDDPLWGRLALRCHGCGACASTCPTCHCFDIVDEPDGLAAGVRRRNGDTCQASQFTLHASGHNPRPAQDSRFRQRIVHKFGIYPERFGEVLCTGCGRCTRGCPAGMNLVEVLRAAEGRA